MNESAYPDRYVITGTVKDGEHAGQKVWLCWTDEGGGWWQWGPEGWAERFPGKNDHRFKDAMRCASAGVGPWYNYVDLSTVHAEATPAIVAVTVR